MRSPSATSKVGLCRGSPAWHTVPSDLITQDSAHSPRGTRLRLLFLVARPTPQTPDEKIKNNILKEV